MKWKIYILESRMSNTNMVPDILELPKREGSPVYIDTTLAYLLNILSYFSCTIYEIDEHTNE